MCTNGRCINYVPPTCTPNCIDKQCGDDNCGGVCGTCSSGYNCLNGQCIYNTPSSYSSCTPNCIDKQCGSDGCGGSCGTCDNLHTCDSLSGKCRITSGCENCDDNNLCTIDNCYPGGGEVRCTNFPKNCPNGQWCDPANGECGDKCFPNCAGKTCGDDNCGGSCGSCGSGQYCSGGNCQYIPICSDSDSDFNHPNGMNPQVLGITIGENDLGLNFLHSKSSKTDYCLPGFNFDFKTLSFDFDSYSLMEYFCSGSYVSSKAITCKTPCKGGECIDINCVPKQCAQQNIECGEWNDGCNGTVDCENCSEGQSCNSMGKCISNNCVDSDRGLNYNLKGNVEDKFNRIFYDSCINSTVLNETYCNNSAAAAFNLTICQHQCINGACTCTANTCVQLGKTCGTWNNGCGTLISCGNCTDGGICNTNGMCIENCPNSRIIGNATDINTSITGITVLVDGKIIGSECFDGMHEMVIYYNNKSVISFVHNFSSEKLYMNKIKFDINLGFVNIDLGEQLLDGESKTIYLNINTTQVADLCLKDSNVNSYEDFSDDCSAPDEINLKDCIGKKEGYLSGYIQCKDEGDRFVLSNLKHSAVRANQRCRYDGECMNSVWISYAGWKNDYPCMKCDCRTGTCVRRLNGERCSDLTYGGLCSGGSCVFWGQDTYRGKSCYVRSNANPPQSVDFLIGYSPVTNPTSPGGYENSPIYKTVPVRIGECNDDFECGIGAVCKEENGKKKCFAACDAKKCEVGELIPSVCSGLSIPSISSGKCVSSCTGIQQCVIGTGSCSECGKDSECPSGNVCIGGGSNGGGRCVASNGYCSVSSDCPPGNICSALTYRDSYGNQVMSSAYCSPGVECDSSHGCVAWGKVCKDGRCIASDSCSSDANKCDIKSCMYYNPNTQQCYSSCSGDARCINNPGAETSFCLSPKNLCSPCEKYVPGQGCVDNSGPCNKCVLGIVEPQCDGCQKCSLGTCVNACLGGNQICRTKTDNTKICGNKNDYQNYGFFGPSGDPNPLGIDYKGSFISFSHFDACHPICDPFSPYSYVNATPFGSVTEPCSGKECQDIGCGYICPAQGGQGGTEIYTECSGDKIIQKQPYCSGGSTLYDTTTLEDCSLRTDGYYTCGIVISHDGGDYYGHSITTCVLKTCNQSVNYSETTHEGVCGEDFFCQSCEKCSDDKKSCIPNPTCDETKCEKYNCEETTNTVGMTTTTEVDRSCTTPANCNCINKECRNCKKNSDCNTNELCIDGKCEKNMCIDNTNCPTGMNCQSYQPGGNDYGKCMAPNCTYDSDCDNENMICAKNSIGLGVCKDKNCPFIPNALASQYCGAGRICKTGLSCPSSSECQFADCTLNIVTYKNYCPEGLRPTSVQSGGIGSSACKCVECTQSSDCVSRYTCSDNKCIKSQTISSGGSGSQCTILPNGTTSCPNGGCSFCTSNEIEILNPGAQNKFCADNCNQGDCMKVDPGTGQCEYSCDDCETCNSGICIPKCDEKKEDCVIKETTNSNGQNTTSFVCETKPLKMPDIYTIQTSEKNCAITINKTKCTPNCTNSSRGIKPDGASDECGGYCGECKEEYSCIQGDDNVQRVTYNKKEWVKITNSTSASSTINANVINTEGLSSEKHFSFWQSIINFITGYSINTGVQNPYQNTNNDVIAECKVVGDPVYQETCGECETCIPNVCNSCTNGNCQIGWDSSLSEYSSDTPLTCRADMDLEGIPCGNIGPGTIVKNLVLQGNSNCPLCDNINPPKEGFCKSGKCVSEIPENLCANEPIGTNALTEYKFTEIINIIKSGNSKEIQDNINLLDTKLINANFPNPSSTNEDIENYLKIISLWIDSYQYGKIREFPPLYGKRTNNGPLIKCSDIIPYCSSSPYQDDQYWPEEILEFIREYYLEKKNSNTNWGDREEINYIRTTLLLGSYYAHYAEFGPPLGHPITDRTDYPIDENRRNFYFTASERYYNYIDQYLPDKNIDRSELYSAIADLKMIEFKHYHDYDNLLQNDINQISSSQLQILVSKQNERIQSLNAVLQYRKAALDSVPINSNDFKSKTQLYKSRLLQTKKNIVDSMMKRLDSSLEQNWENFKDRFPLEGPTYANEKTLRDYTSKWIQYTFTKNQVFRTIQSLWTIGAEDAAKNSDKNEKVINSMKISLSIIRLMLERGYDLNEYKTLPVEDKLKLIRDVYDPGFSNDSLTKCITLTNNPNFQNTPYTASVDEIKRCMGLYLIKCDLEITMDHFSDIKILMQDGNIDGMNKIFDLEKVTGTLYDPTTPPLDYLLPVYQFKFVGKEKIVNNGKLGEQRYYYLLNYLYSPENDYERMDIEYELTELTPVRLANKFIMAYYSLKIPGIIINSFESGGILLATKTSAHILGTVAIFEGGNYALEEYVDPSGTAGDVFGIALIGADLFRFGKALYLGKNEQGYVELFGKFDNVQAGKNYISYLESVGAKVETTPGNDFEYKINGKRFRILLDAPPSGAQDLSDFIDFANSIAKKIPEMPKYPQGVQLIKDQATKNKLGEAVKQEYNKGRENDCTITEEQARGLQFISEKTKQNIINGAGDADLFVIPGERTISIFKSDFSSFFAKKMGLIDSDVMEIGRTAGLNRENPNGKRDTLNKIFYSALLQARARGAKYLISVTNVKDGVAYNRYFSRGEPGTVTNVNDIVRADDNFRRSQGPLGPDGRPVGITIVPVTDKRTGEMKEIMKIIIEPGPPETSLEVDCNLYDVEKSIAYLERLLARCR